MCPYQITKNDIACCRVTGNPVCNEKDEPQCTVAATFVLFERKATEFNSHKYAPDFGDYGSNPTKVFEDNRFD